MDIKIAVSLIGQVIIGVVFVFIEISRCAHIKVGQNQGRIEHPRPPDISGVGGWNMAYLYLNFVTFQYIILF